MRAGYLNEFARHWQSDAHPARRWRRFERAAYTGMNTETCAGHATIAIDTLPGTHGMGLVRPSTR